MDAHADWPTARGPLRWPVPAVEANLGCLSSVFEASRIGSVPVEEAFSLPHPLHGNLGGSGFASARVDAARGVTVARRVSGLHTARGSGNDLAAGANAHERIGARRATTTNAKRQTRRFAQRWALNYPRPEAVLGEQILNKMTRPRPGDRRGFGGY